MKTIVTLKMYVFLGGNGFIDIHDPDSYNLPPPIRVNGQNLYAIAAFHQLHCLVKTSLTQPLDTLS